MTSSPLPRPASSSLNAPIPCIVGEARDLLFFPLSAPAAPAHRADYRLPPFSPRAPCKPRRGMAPPPPVALRPQPRFGARLRARTCALAPAPAPTAARRRNRMSRPQPRPGCSQPATPHPPPQPSCPVLPTASPAAAATVPRLRL
nr:translation initiation factor IF-2-like [Aegilops tauschii subsp. strangulata]